LGFLGERGHVGDGNVFASLLQKRLDSVGEVGEGEELSIGEGVKQRGLVYTSPRTSALVLSPGIADGVRTPRLWQSSRTDPSTVSTSPRAQPSSTPLSFFSTNNSRWGWSSYPSPRRAFMKVKSRQYSGRSAEDWRTHYHRRRDLSRQGRLRWSCHLGSPMGFERPGSVK
jgi:hypothetical protein